MKYYIRSNNQLIGMIDNGAFKRFMETIRGRWQPKKFTNGRTVNAYVVTEECSFGTEALRIYLEEGAYVYAS